MKIFPALFYNKNKITVWQEEASPKLITYYDKKTKQVKSYTKYIRTTEYYKLNSCSRGIIKPPGTYHYTSKRLHGMYKVCT